MKAVAVVEAGLPARIVDIETPTPGAGDIRVRLSAAGVNPLDGKTASGAYGQVDLPFIPGTDGAGVVEAVGEGSSEFSVGDRVFGRLGRQGRGTYAEYVVVPEAGVVARIPEGVEFGPAAALPVAGLTAMGLLRDLALHPGARLLVVGATGGVGSFLVQLAARSGLEVIATARPELADRLRRLGATVTVDHSSPVDLRQQLAAMDITKVDGMADLVGSRPLVEQLSTLLHPGSRVISTAGGVEPESLATRQISGVNYHGTSTVAMLQDLGGLVRSGDIVVPVERELSLGDAPRALEESLSGHLHGKTILRIA